MIKDFETECKENKTWLNQISSYYTEGVDHLTGYTEAVKSMTPAKISAFVKKVLAQGNHLEVIMLPEADKK